MNKTQQRTLKGYNVYAVQPGLAGMRKQNKRPVGTPGVEKAKTASMTGKLGRVIAVPVYA